MGTGLGMGIMGLWLTAGICQGSVCAVDRMHLTKTRRGWAADS